VLADANVGRYDIANLSVLVDQVSYSPYADTERPINVVHFDRDLFRIAKQLKRQFVFLSESLVTCRVLRANAGDLQANRLNVRVYVTDGTRFFGAAWRKICRIEIQD
jgi:hypothetical protein